MGYTHYWRNVGSFPPGFVVNAALITEREGKLLTDIETDSFRISFNGRGEGAHETFVLRSNANGFAFCKTAAKPYDVAVTAVLALAVHFGVIQASSLTSDGGVKDWEPGVRLARLATGLDVANPFDTAQRASVAAPSVKNDSANSSAPATLTLSLAARSAERIESLKGLLGLSTDAEVVGRALSLLNTLAVAVSKGDHVHLVRKNGDILLLDTIVSD